MDLFDSEFVEDIEVRINDLTTELIRLAESLDEAVTNPPEHRTVIQRLKLKYLSERFGQRQNS